MPNSVAEPVVLIVDDREENLAVLEVVLRQLPCRIVPAQTGQEAIDYLEKNEEVAVVLLDVQMPGMDGFQAATLIRQLPHHKVTPIIFVTAIDQSPERLRQAYAAGAVDILFKPLEDFVVQSKVATFLELHALRVTTRAQNLARLKVVTDAIPDFVSYINPELKYEFVNSAYLRWTSAHENQIVGKHIQEIIGEEQAGRSIPYLKRALNGEAVTYQASVVWPDGTEQYVDVRANPHFDFDGKVRGVVILGHDVTAQKQIHSDQAFRAQLVEELSSFTDADLLIGNSTQLLANYLKASRCFVTEINPKTGMARVYDDFSNGFAKLNGLYELSTFGPEMLESWRSGRVATVTDVRTDDRTRSHYQNHEQIGIRAFITVPFIKAKELVGALSVSSHEPREWIEREIEVVRLVGDAIWSAFERVKLARLSSERLQILADAGVALSSSLDFSKTLTNLGQVVIPRMADWCSIQLLERDGTLKQVAVAHSDPKKIEYAWELNRKFPPLKSPEQASYRVVRTGKPELVPIVTDEMLVASSRSEEHLRIIRELGFTSYLIVPIKARDRVLGTMALVSTESKRQFGEEDLSLAQEIASRAGLALENARLFRESQNINQLKDEFLATLSHELRTPLSVILGNSEILLSERRTLTLDESAKSLDAIHRNATIQNNIIRDLLDVSSIITGKFSFKPMEVSPGDTIVAAAQGLAQTAKARGIQLHCDYADAPESMRADPTRLHQIVWNLVSNAIKFTPSGGRVDLKVYERGNECVIEVSDTGLGIEPEFLPYVFDRFRQEDSSTSRRFGGLGLGLSIVRHLTEIHGGQVSATSPGKGQGSRFTVELPITHGLAGAEPHAISAAPLNEVREEKNVDLSGVKILLVEDSLDNRVLVSRILSKVGADVRNAESAAQAREVLRSYRPDLIVSDIGMPDETGIEFIQKLRSSSEERTREIPAIALTAYVRPEEREKAMDAGFQAHVGKPVTASALLSEISEVLKT